MECNTCYLHEMKTGQTAVILSLDTEGSIRRRLIDLGLIEGTRVRCMLRKRRGESAAFLIRGTVIALRREDACHIRIRPEPAACDGRSETVCLAAECHSACCQAADCGSAHRQTGLSDKPAAPK